ncbi:hypothetical protein [Enterococcus pallens]|uniref:DUF5648 domain-containing protein n=1 Tax=Enterococcus pallens ATCC BAA-351 TaxID=1158607 RepID=R2RT86_9ENTE|nr:hypothetical protein [Enterococcus pallens]EOH86515.1 hypothetical protein UAU_04955 [Enterococcus pallens ATCC BAA-351]EOU18311.1 hypothetical protein I588_03300 [Enterococcus pallens ATCC BAA-351]OJG81376.1 hypothetical protein RV10_GL003504 [Enterococcus pallens]
MKKLFIKGAFLVGMLAATSFSAHSEAATTDMHRVYNPNSGEHFYTQNGVEKDILVKAGWRYEGVGWFAPQSGNPVYRVYNANAGDHHYTVDWNEKEALVKVGWKYEGIGWYSDAKKTIPLYRAYNPNAKAGSHNYTVNANEQKMLLSAGWREEGIAWYGTNRDSTDPIAISPIGNSGVFVLTSNEAHAAVIAFLTDQNSPWYSANGINGNKNHAWLGKIREVQMSDGSTRYTVDFILYDKENNVEVK